MGCVDKFDTSVSILISSLVGAGVFALPLLSRQLGLLSIIVLAGAFAYMLGLGYIVVELTPGTVEEEVELHLGQSARQVLVAAELAVVMLALTAYALGLRAHLGASSVVVFAILAIPLVMDLHFPANFTQFIAFFTLFFVSVLSLLVIPRMELPIGIALRQTATSPPVAGTPAADLSAAAPLFLAAAFAFYGHNMIPHIRNILRDKAITRRAFYMALAIVFLLYLPFAVSVSGIGVDGLATTFIASYFSEPLSSIIDLFSVVIFYTSFIIFGLHLVGEFGDRQRGLTAVVGGTLLLYLIAGSLSAPFHLVVAAAGLAVTIYAFITAMAGMVAGKLRPVPQVLAGSTVLAWLFLLLQAF